MPTPATATQPFRVWRDGGAVLLRFADGASAELSSCDVQALAAALMSTTQPRRTRATPNHRWTAQRVAELRRLYVGESRTASECAAALKTTAMAIRQQVWVRGFSRRPHPGHWKKLSAVKDAT